MARNHGGYNTERSEFYGAMQRVVDTLFYEEDTLLEAHSAAPGAANTGALRDVAPAESAVAGSARSAAPAAQWEGAAASSGADALRDDASGAVRSGAHAADSQGSFAQRLGVPASTAALLGLAAFDDPALRSAAMGDAAGAQLRWRWGARPMARLRKREARPGTRLRKRGVWPMARPRLLWRFLRLPCGGSTW